MKTETESLEASVDGYKTNISQYSEKMTELQQKQEKRKSSNNFQFDFSDPAKTEDTAKTKTTTVNPFDDMIGQSVDPSVPHSGTSSSFAQLPISPPFENNTLTSSTQFQQPTPSDMFKPSSSMFDMAEDINPISDLKNDVASTETKLSAQNFESTDPFGTSISKTSNTNAFASKPNWENSFGSPTPQTAPITNGLANDPFASKTQSSDPFSAFGDKAQNVVSGFDEDPFGAPTSNNQFTANFGDAFN